MAKSGTGGGAATHSGTDYQNRCGAWFAVLILAERSANPPLGFPAKEILESIQCEVNQPVDDLVVATRTAGFVFGQVKHSLNLQIAEDSDLASTIEQFVCQFLRARSLAAGALPAGRALASNLDRLALLTSSSSSGPIVEHLSTFLRRLRETQTLQPGAAVESFATNAGERNACDAVKSHFIRSWARTTGGPPSEAEIVQVLALVHVLVLDVDDGEVHEQTAKDLLRTSVLRDPTQADAAWAALVSACAGYARHRSGADREGLQRVLQGAGIEIRAVHGCREDFAKPQWPSPSDERWKAVPCGKYYVVWSGPVNYLNSREPVSLTDRHCKAARVGGMEVRTVPRGAVAGYQKTGWSVLFETDCKQWCRQLTDRGLIAIVRPARPAVHVDRPILLKSPTVIAFFPPSGSIDYGPGSEARRVIDALDFDLVTVEILCDEHGILFYKLHSDALYFSDGRRTRPIKLSCPGLCIGICMATPERLPLVLYGEDSAERFSGVAAKYFRLKDISDR